jgi:hypothetical protein
LIVVCRRWETKLMSRAHLAVTGAAGPSCQIGREEQDRVGRTFDMP